MRNGNDKINWYKCNIDEIDEDDSANGWVSWFCELDGHEFFVEVDEDYITDSFNLYGLKNLIPRYE